MMMDMMGMAAVFFFYCSNTGSDGVKGKVIVLGRDAG